MLSCQRVEGCGELLRGHNDVHELWVQHVHAFCECASLDAGPAIEPCNLYLVPSPHLGLFLVLNVQIVVCAHSFGQLSLIRIID